MKALTLKHYGGQHALQTADIAAPIAGHGQLLVRVQAAGVNGLDWKIRQGNVRDAFPLVLPAVLGIELAGVVEAIGAGVTGFRAGDRVMGALGGLGAYGELAVINEANVCVVPDNLAFHQAAALPVAILCAWQSIHAKGELQPGQRVLIHGAAGGVGGFAVQLARQAGAQVFVTARLDYADYLYRLGAHQVIDYEAGPFEQQVTDIDLVMDYVGGEVTARSWQVLKAGGTLVSTASPEIVSQAPAGRSGIWFMMKPDGKLLATLSEQVANGLLQSRIDRVVDFAQLATAIEQHRTLHHSGKTVVTVNH